MVDKRRILKESRLGRHLGVDLGGAQVRQGEHGVVVTDVRQRIEAFGHVGDGALDAAGLTGGALVGAAWLERVRLWRQQRRPAHKDRILRRRRYSRLTHGDYKCDRE